MPRNVEIKAKCRDLAVVRAKAIALAGGNTTPEVLNQTDTFFKSPTGRLKLRVVNEVSYIEKHHISPEFLLDLESGADTL